MYSANQNAFELCSTLNMCSLMLQNYFRVKCHDRKVGYILLSLFIQLMPVIPNSVAIYIYFEKKVNPDPERTTI